MASASLDEFLSHPFDFLIVGGGTAGLVLASRLSEDVNVQVGVVEAGVSRLGDSKVELPTGMGEMLNNPEYDWNNRSVPQEGANNRVFHLPRGKMLGGSSGINFMAYGRPCAVEMDDWAEKLGLPGWSWAELLPYFKRSERLEANQPNIQNRDRYECPLGESLHGLNGPIHTTIGTWQSPFEKLFLPALNRIAGLSPPREPYGGSRLGFYRSLFTLDRTAQPIRSYAANGYLAPIAERRNLKILTDAIVSKILLDTTNDEKPIARGIKFLYRRRSYHAFAKAEVILSAGAFKSPQLLELSGIGDPVVLGNAGISCIVENDQVGDNLQEHPMSAVVYELAPGGVSVDSALLDAAVAEEHQRLYSESGSGIMSGVISLTGYLPYASQVSKYELDKTLRSIETDPYIASTARDPPPSSSQLSNRTRQRSIIADRIRSGECSDIQLLGLPSNFDIKQGHSDLSRLFPGPPPDHNACYTLIVSPMHVLSRGRVHIQSPRVEEEPQVDPGFLSHPADVDILAAGVAFADRAFQSTPVKNKVTRRVDPPRGVDLQDAAAARNFVRDRITTYHHALGTCSMGQVVDERLRVKGVDSLRVVDASVMPMQVSVAIVATVYAIAEKAADMIKEDHRRGHPNVAQARL